MTETKHREDESDEFKVADRRHWAEDDADDSQAGNDDSQDSEAEAKPTSTTPTILDEYRERTESAERQLQDYIEAFKKFKDEQDGFRSRLERDVERRVELAFAGLVEGFLESIDHLDLALQHADGIPEAQPLADGVRMARKRFLDTLESAGVERIDPAGATFDPNEAEALRLDPVEHSNQDGAVTETLQPGYKLGSQVIRPARVAVGRKNATSGD